jgi:fructosamine-3-kinase
MIPDQVEESISDYYRSEFNEEIKIQSSHPISGGSINEAWRIDTNLGKLFLKYNYSERYPYMFEKEAMGLRLLKEESEFHIPEVKVAGDGAKFAFIVLEYLESGKRRKDYWTELGRRLANMHQNSNVYFGLDHDNFMGSLPQYNIAHDEWVDFFICERLEKQVELAFNNDEITKTLMQKFEVLYSKLEEIFPPEAPALLHGDLWNGNVMTAPDGSATLIDPAVYYGHREIDIAMTKLFGGFDSDFYHSYNETFPLEEDWDERVDICNLYPLLIHLNLFGSSYLSGIKKVLKKF